MEKQTIEKLKNLVKAVKDGDREEAERLQKELKGRVKKVETFLDFLIVAQNPDDYGAVECDPKFLEFIEKSIHEEENL